MANTTDRNAQQGVRNRRNWQKGVVGGFTGGITVAAPLQNTGSQIQLNLFANGGLTNTSGQLTIKLDTTPALQLLAGGLSVLLDPSSPGLQRTSGLKILLNPTGGLSVGASGVAFSLLTTKGDLAGFGTAIARIPIGTNNQVLTADSTTALGLKWATPSTSGVTSVEVEVDFGATPTFTKSFTIVDAGVLATSKILAIQSGNTPTGGQSDAAETDHIDFACIPAAGSFTLLASTVTGPVTGKMKVFYHY